MITVNNLSLSFGGTTLFSRVDLQFIPGNCYGVIGANGSGKSSFLKILSGELEHSTGSVEIKPNVRMSVLKQDQNMYDKFTVIDTVIMGNPELYECGKEKDALYLKEDFSDADGILAAELEEKYAELGGWEAESDASQLLQGLGISTALHHSEMAALEPRQKVKVLLAQALFGKPDIILLDEPTNNLDVGSVVWLEDFLMDYEGTVIVVAHDRYFLNTVCTHIVDIDFGKIKMYVGNYDFWYDSSQLMQKLIKEKNKKNEDKISELEEFVRRFSANKSKSRQATSRKKLIEKIKIDEMPASTRRYPWVGFKMEREPGKDRLFVTDVSKTIDGVKVLDKVSFIMDKNDKIAFIGENENAITTMFQLLSGEIEPDEGEIKWGVSTSQAYFPKDNSPYFEDGELSIIDWIRQYSEDKRESYLRTFLGRMLFTGDDVYKEVRVLSGGEKVRCMLSKLMLSGCSILLLDQPTNHLDLESVATLNNGLVDFKGNVILTTHDHQLIQTMANRIIEFTDGEVIDRAMTYDEYVDTMKAENRQE
ncbi:MAG: ATP-binding cassette domain-containing protein [Oscillospiraceae bacterium]|nr:ATP-binding cassette domain-containing protein [Oscillospiraceae bacterium]MCL2278701.1 ATP-binding cassette domain-containing protein [Oscillospiraceae bacterium]